MLCDPLSHYSVTRCEYYSIVDKDLITELWFPRVKIPPKPIIGFIKENTKEPWVEIIKIIKFFMNISGYWRNIFTYVVPTLLNLVIIRLLWIREDNIIIRLIANILIINSYGLTVLIKIIPILSEMKELIVTPFIILIKRARKYQKQFIILKISQKDITKVLYFKVIRILIEIWESLPA